MHTHTRAVIWYIYRLHIGALYIEFNFFTPRQEWRNRNPADVVRLDEGLARMVFRRVCSLTLYINICIYYILSGCRAAGGQVVAAERVLQLPPRGQWVFVVMSDPHYARTHNTALLQHPGCVCVCVCVCSGHIQLLFPAEKTRSGRRTAR